MDSFDIIIFDSIYYILQLSLPYMVFLNRFEKQALLAQEILDTNAGAVELLARLEDWVNSLQQQAGLSSPDQVFDSAFI